MKKIAFKLVTATLLGILLVGGGDNSALSQESAPNNPFVYMREGKTYYQGDEYFLKTVNYILSVIIDENDNIVVAPHSNYANWFTPDMYGLPETQEEANNYFRAHFKMMKDMGLNSIRVMHCAVQPRWDNAGLALVLLLRHTSQLEYENRVRDKKSCEHVPYLQYENLDENGMVYFKQAMQIVLDIANEYDLKVIWVTGGGTKYKDCESGLLGNDTVFKYASILNHYNNPITIAYSEFLSEISNEFKDHTALFTYDLCNEPESFENEDFPNDLPVNKVSLGDCMVFLNNSIKNNDPNHYTTIGLFGQRTFFKQGIKPFYYCDFVNIHIYNSLGYLHDDLSIGTPVNRYIYYFNKTIECPWLIGENGTETEANETAGEEVENDIRSINTETEQRNEAKIIMDFSAACGAFGYAYWQFGNERDWQNFGLIKAKWTPMQIVVNNDPHETYPIHSEYNEIVYPFENSIFNTFSTTEGACVFDEALYYDISQSEEENYKWDGFVKDQAGFPVADAIVRIEVKYHDISVEHDINTNNLTAFYTFTDANGYYSLGIDNTEDNRAHISATKYAYQMTIKKDCSKLFSHDLQIDYIDTYSPKQEYIHSITVTDGQTVVLDKPTMINGNVIVYNGGTLIIRDTVSLGEQTQFTVMPGGTLILEENATLTAIHQQWLGIVLDGDGSPYSIDFFADENATIAKAIIAVSASGHVNFNINGMTFIKNQLALKIQDNGNAIALENIKFTNNVDDIKIYNNNVSGNDEVLLNNNNFTTTSDALLVVETSASFYNCSNVIISDCKFVDNRQFSSIRNTVGIEANSSDLTIRSTTLTENQESLFAGLNTGVDVTQSSIDIINTNFIDNKNDVCLDHIADETRFSNCNFIRNSNNMNLSPVSRTLSFVCLDFCELVSFHNCKFADNNLDAETTPKKIGIFASEVDKLIVSPNPLNSLKRSSFTNLLYGVYFMVDYGMDYALEVKETDFLASRGIYVYSSGYANVKIINNNFTIKDCEILEKAPWDPDEDPPPPPASEDFTRSYGVYIDGNSARYHIEGNKFLSENNNTDDKYGLIAKDNGTIAQEFYRNEFNSLENGVQSIGINKNNEDGSTNGLEILCNNFSNIKTDIFVTTNEFYQPTEGIAMYQGSLDKPTGNLFSNLSNENAFVNNLSSIQYFIRNLSDPNFDFREWPANVVPEDVNVITIFISDIEDLCKDNTTSLPFPSVNIADLLSELDNSQILEDALDDMIEDVVDGGNTGQTLSDIIHLDDNSAWITYYELMNKSPYLSDTVLKDISKKETGLTVAMIRDILVANPQAAKNKDLKKLLHDRNVQLPDYMIEQIDAGLSQISSKEYLEIQKTQQRKIYETNLFELVNYYYSISDSLAYAEDSIVNLLSKRGDAKYLYVLSDYYASLGKYELTTSNLIYIKDNCDIDDAERNNIADLIDYYNYYQTVINDSKIDILNLGEEELKAFLQFELAGGDAGRKARGILLMNDASTYMEPVFRADIIVAPKSAAANNTFNSNEPSFSIYPNPAKEYISVEYKLLEQKDIMQLVISDISGKIIKQQQLYHLQDIVIVKTLDLPTGTYTCSLYNGSRCAFTSKFVIKN